jgi:hypothetical protein
MEQAAVTMVEQGHDGGFDKPDLPTEVLRRVTIELQTDNCEAMTVDR